MDIMNMRCIRCRECGGKAYFDTPFEWIHNPSFNKDEIRDSSLIKDDYLYKYPDEYPTRQQHFETLYPFRGISYCPHCKNRRKIDLNWPKDAYYQVDVRGHVLWANHLEDLKFIYKMIEKTHRPSELLMPTFYRVPKYFKLAKHREIVLKLIARQFPEVL